MISIIVPIYNTSQYLYDCLFSIQHQSYKDFEALCVDDGSTDNSSNIVEQFINSDSRFRLYQQSNAGVSAARNLGLVHARGEYVCFIDADDVVDTDYLLNLIKLSKDGCFSLCTYSRDLTNLGKRETKVTEYSAREFVCNIINETIEHPNIWMMLFKMQIINIHHLDFYLGCVRNEDAEFFLKYLLYENKVRISNYQGYYYRPNEKSAMHITTMKSLTGLDASKRIGSFLFENGYTNNINIDLYPTLQSMLYHLSREKNKEIYDYIHKEYDIKGIMKELLSYKSRRRKCFALLYLLTGKSLFFRIFSSKVAGSLPL